MSNVHMTVEDMEEYIKDIPKQVRKEKTFLNKAKKFRGATLRVAGYWAGFIVKESIAEFKKGYEDVE